MTHEERIARLESTTEFLWDCLEGAVRILAEDEKKKVNVATRHEMLVVLLGLIDKGCAAFDVLQEEEDRDRLDRALARARMLRAADQMSED